MSKRSGGDRLAAGEPITHAGKIMFTGSAKSLTAAAEPSSGMITKADVVNYYRAVSSAMLRQLRNRPLIFQRFPEGTGNPGFFQREIPRDAPDWMERVRYGKEVPKNYIITKSTRSLLWLANRDVIELHQTTVRYPDLTHPDQLVFDLDPGEGGFPEAVSTALLLHQYLTEIGLPSFAKTSGGRGVHVVCPIVPVHPPEKVTQWARNFIRSFLLRHPGSGTLEMRKDKRRNQLYIDLYRNHAGQATACAYSLRARPGAPVSMPVAWDGLADLQEPSVFNLRSVPGLIGNNDDPWSAYFESSGNPVGDS